MSTHETAYALVALLSSCGPVEQTESCQAFVTCVEARDAVRSTTTNVDRFAAGGACWGGEEGAHLCDTACSRGMEWIRASYTDLPAECY